MEVPVYIPLKHTREVRWCGIAPLILNFGMYHGEWSASHKCHVTINSNLHGTPPIVGCVGRNASLDNSKKKMTLGTNGIQTLDHQPIS